MLQRLFLRLAVVLLSAATWTTIFAGPTLQWQFTTGERIVGSPTVAEDRLLVGSDDGHLYALRRGDGHVLWRYRTEGAISCTPAVADGRVFITSRDGALHAVDLPTGRPLWRFATQGEQQVDIWDYFLSSPAVTTGLVVFGSGDGHVYALDAASGEVRWSFAAHAVVHASPLIIGDTAYIGDFGGRMHALELTTGKVRWQFKTVGDRYFTAGAIQGSAGAGPDVIYFGSRDYNLYAVDARAGHGWWNFKERSWVVTRPLAVDGMVVYGTSDTHLVIARDAGSGEERWRRPLRLNVFAGTILWQGQIVAGGVDGRLRGLDPATGETRWEYHSEPSRQNAPLLFASEHELRSDFRDRYRADAAALYNDMFKLGSILSPPVAEGDWLYYAATDGVVRALRLNRQPVPTP
jgi:eukaryotic-like serine/threonine-protein kinase